MPSRKRRIGQRIAIFVSAVALAGLAAGWYIGYFSNDPVKLVLPEHRRGYAKVVFLSGDLGLNMGMGPKIAARLASAGLPIVGFNSLTYFRQERTPAQVTATVRWLIDRANREFGTGPVILIGQSFGADALQLALADFTPQERNGIALVVLIVPTDSVYLRASPAEMFNLTPANIPSADTARLIRWVPMLCIHGQVEDHSLCPLLSAGNVTSVALPGGHYLDHDTDRVSDIVLSAVRQVEKP